MLEARHIFYMLCYIYVDWLHMQVDLYCCDSLFVFYFHFTYLASNHERKKTCLGIRIYFLDLSPIRLVSHLDGITPGFYYYATGRT